MFAECGPLFFSISFCHLFFERLHLHIYKIIYISTYYIYIYIILTLSIETTVWSRLSALNELTPFIFTRAIARHQVPGELELFDCLKHQDVNICETVSEFWFLTRNISSVCLHILSMLNVLTSTDSLLPTWHRTLISCWSWCSISHTKKVNRYLENPGKTLAHWRCYCQVKVLILYYI